jgi:hypothetical protein
MAAKIKSRDERLTAHVQSTLSTSEWAILEQIERDHACSRSEALRIALRTYATATQKAGAE